MCYPNLQPNEVKLIKSFIEECTVIDLLGNVKTIAAKFRLKYKLKLPDAIIAACAFIQEVPLITADKNFAKVKELEVFLIEI